MIGQSSDVVNKRCKNVSLVENAGRDVEQDVKLPAVADNIVLWVCVDPWCAECEYDVRAVVQCARDCELLPKLVKVG